MISKFSEVIRAYHLKQPHAHSLFLFSMVFGINLIPFYNWKKGGAAVCSTLCLRFFDDLLRNFERCGTKRKKFGNGKCALNTNFSIALQLGYNLGMESVNFG